MIRNFTVRVAVVVLFTNCALAQSNSNRIGDDYARGGAAGHHLHMQCGGTAQVYFHPAR